MARAADVAAALRDRFRIDPRVTKIHKLLYYCQGWHLVWTHEPLFPERIEPWKLGPVVAELWRDEKYASKPQVKPLSPIEECTVDYVVARYGHLWAFQLVGRTHKEAPWVDAIERGAPVLSLKQMEDFFSADPAADQAWFWSEDWLGGEREADEDLKAGRFESFDSTEAFLDSLPIRRAEE